MTGKLRSFGVPILFSFLAFLSGCGSSTPKSCLGTCTLQPTEFLYAPGGNGISSFTLSTAGVPTPLGNQAGPNESEGIVVDPSAKFLYVSDFANGSVDAFTINATSGGLTVVPGSPFLVFLAGSASGGIAVDPSTKFLYVTLVNVPAVAAFSINSSSGALTAVPGSPFATGNTPFQVITDPSGKFLYVSNLNDSQGAISAYTIDSTSGALTPVLGSPFSTQSNFPGPNAGSPFAVLTGPDALTVDPTGAFLYVADSSSSGGDISVFSISAATGVLTAIGGSPFSTGPQSLIGLAIAKTH